MRCSGMLGRVAVTFAAATCGACASTERDARVALAAAELREMKDATVVAPASVERPAADEGTPTPSDLVPFVLPSSAGGEYGSAIQASRADAARRLDAHPEVPRVMVELVLSVSARSRH